jgi:hypothetical protein
MQLRVLLLKHLIFGCRPEDALLLGNAQYTPVEPGFPRRIPVIKVHKHPTFVAGENNSWVVSRKCHRLCSVVEEKPPQRDAPGHVEGNP